MNKKITFILTHLFLLLSYASISMDGPYFDQDAIFSLELEPSPGKQEFVDHDYNDISQPVHSPGPFQISQPVVVLSRVINESLPVYLKPRIDFDVLLKEVGEKAVYKKLLEKNILFGSLIAKEFLASQTDSIEKLQRIANTKNLFTKTFEAYRQTMAFDKLLEVVATQVRNLSYEDKISIVKSFRHLKHPKNTQKPNQLGDFVSEYIILNLIDFSSLSPEQKAEALYELSQVYSHLIEESYGKVIWQEESDTGILNWQTVNGISGNKISVSFSELLVIKMNLLKNCLAFNSDHKNCWVRLGEHYLFDLDDPYSIYNDGSNFKKEQDSKYLFEKYESHLPDSDASMTKKAHIMTANKNKILNDVKAKQEAVKAQMANLKKQNELKRKAENELLCGRPTQMLKVEPNSNSTNARSSLKKIEIALSNKISK